MRLVPAFDERDVAPEGEAPERSGVDSGDGGEAVEGDDGKAPVASFDDTSTAPIDLVAWADARTTTEHDDGESADPAADAAEADRAAREALRRWAASE